MNQLKAPQVFVRRFDAVRTQMLQVQVARAAIRSLIVLMAGLALLIALDYVWEAPRIVRQIGLYGLFVSAGVAAAAWIFAAFNRWSRPRTALEIEEHFPELGQSVRTAVQFGGRSDADIAENGVRSTLVDALEEQLDAETGPLPIEAIVPTRSMQIAMVVSAILCVALGMLCWTNSEWNTAAHRTMLEETPYTNMEVTPGTTHIEQGSDLTIAIELAGRTNLPVTLMTRKSGVGAGEWQEQAVVADDVKPSKSGTLLYEIPFTKVQEPFDYRVVAGKLHSDEYQVILKYPLKIEQIEVTLTPPSYTRRRTTTVHEGNIQALEGTSAEFRFELDRAPVAAKFLLIDPRDRLAREGDDTPAPIEVPATIDGKFVTMELEMTQDKVYSLVAISDDDMPLPENSFRIRVRKDQPPSVSFEEPSEALEVHTLAEVALRLRARDDFGLSKAGIVFQINNEEEHTLLQKDFEEALVAAESEAAESDRPAPSTQAVLEQLLPLEHFELTQRDSVTYYAFAEDNFPGGARRAESDLRFIDIRPFRRNYQLFDPEDVNGMQQGKPLPLLDELIARQRFALNRTLQLARRANQALSAANGGALSQDDLNVVDKLVEFEQKLAASTRDLAEALEARMVAGNDLLFQAEESMRAAVDSLTAGKFDNAVLQEKDALHYLIEGRQVLMIGISKKSQKTQAELRAFQRMQMQKLRKPKNEDDAQEIAERLQELADQEEFAYETLTGLKLDEEMPGPGSGKGSGKPKKKPEPKPETQPSDKAEVAANESPEGQKPDDSENPSENPADSAGEKGKQGTAQKGQGTDEPQVAQGDKPADKADGKTGDDKQPDDGAGGDQPDEKSAEMSRAALVEKLADIAAEAAELQKAVDKLKDLSDLARSRMNESLKTAERAAGALERGDSKEAAEATGQASRMFSELARNVAGLAAAETTRKIAVARNVAEELSQSERELANALDRQQSSSASGDEPSDQTGKLASRAERMTEAGKTLADILKGLARSTEPGDREAAAQAQELLKQGKVEETVQRLAAQAPAIKAGKGRETSAEARDVADRFEAAAQRLDGMHRSLVAPRIAELLKVEREAVELQEKLEHLEAQPQIGAWHREADQLIEQLEKLELAGESKDKLTEAMKAAGWNDNRLVGNWNWAFNTGHYASPSVYHQSVQEIVSDLHSIIQELILGDLYGSADETTPPQFERLVERYYQVLSSDK